MAYGASDRGVRPGSEALYPYKMIGRVVVRCKSCGKSGPTSRRLVGRARSIDQCGECKKANPEKT